MSDEQLEVFNIDRVSFLDRRNDREIIACRQLGTGIWRVSIIDHASLGTDKAEARSPVAELEDLNTAVAFCVGVIDTGIVPAITNRFNGR